MAKTLRRLLDEICTTMKTKGAYSAELALVARGLIDDNDQLQFDPRDLATSLSNLLASTGAAGKISTLTSGTDLTTSGVLTTLATNIGAHDTQAQTLLTAILAITTAKAAINAAIGQTYSILGAGTAYTLTATPAAVTFGTTSPALTLAVAGTYLITGTAVVSLTGATFASSRTVTLKLRRTNNTAADVTGGAIAVGTGVTTTQSGPLVAVPIHGLYVASAADAVTIFGDVSTIPSAGSITVDSAKLVAVRVA